MRATRHNGRTNTRGKTYGNKHNDRNFDTERADNISDANSVFNVYWHLYDDAAVMTFAEAERKFYEENFGKLFKQTNEKYIEQRHPERCKTLDEFMKLRRYAPEESHLQIGKMEDGRNTIDGHDEMLACFEAFHAKLENWNEENGRPFTTLDWAFHADEAVPHVQERRVWHYRDEQGQLQIGQEKALEQAGVPLPKPDKPESRYNNRKMTFDAMAREMWLDTCWEHGIEVEREPVPDGRHNRSKEEMVRDKYEEMLKASEGLEKLLKELGDLKAEKAALRVDLDALERTLEEEMTKAEKYMPRATLNEKIAALKQKDQDAKLLVALQKHPDIMQLLQQRMAEQQLREKMQKSKKKESGRDDRA